jgi:hypothetical protein
MFKDACILALTFPSTVVLIISVFFQYILLLDDGDVGCHHVPLEGFGSSSDPGAYASKAVYLLGGERRRVK